MVEKIARVLKTKIFEFRLGNFMLGLFASKESIGGRVSTLNAVVSEL